MTCRRAFLPALLVVIAATVQPRPRAQSPGPLVERVGDTGFIQLQAESFKQLEPRQQALAYWLSQASIAIDPIIYDQLSPTGIREKRLLEEIVDHPQGIAPDTFAKLRSYALLFWANRGNHNETTGQKFLPAFTRNELIDAALRAQQNGAFTSAYADLPALPTGDDVRREIAALDKAIFDWDPKLQELGLVKDQDAVARTMYDDAARVALTQLRRIPTGDLIEEDHQRNRQLIVNYIVDTTGAIERVNRDGKAYIRVKDYQKMREGVGMLLKELMRIKAEGDYAAIKALVDQYGVRFDPAIRDQVVGRYKALDLPTYWAGINPELTAAFDAQDRVTRVTMTYPRDAVAQYLRYGRMYRR